jgi:integrase/recombinase XerD
MRQDSTLRGVQSDGALEKAQQMAAHESAKTTKLFDRTNESITLDEVERIAF